MKINLRRLVLPEQKISSVSLKYPKKLKNVVRKYIISDLELFQKTEKPEKSLKTFLDRNSRGDVIVKIKEKGLFKNTHKTVIAWHEITDHGWTLQFFTSCWRAYNDLKFSKTLK